MCHNQQPRKQSTTVQKTGHQLQRDWKLCIVVNGKTRGVCTNGPGWCYTVSLRLVAEPRQSTLVLEMWVKI